MIFDRLIAADTGERIAKALERIATSLEQAVPPVPADRLSIKKRGPESIVRYGNETKAWQREQISNVVSPMGLAPEADARIRAELEKLLDQRK